MIFLGIVRVHSRVARRQKALWFTALPLTAFAALLAAISPGQPATGGIEDLAFTGQIIAIFTGIAYAAAFTDFLVAPAKLGMQELESSAPVAPLALRCARIVGTFSVVVAPSVAVLLILGAAQTISGNAWSLIGALAVATTVIGPASMIALSISAFAGAILPRAFGRIVAVVLWFGLVFSTPLIPIPTPNGTVFSVVGDAIVAGYFGASPIYSAVGPLGFDDTPLSATISLSLQVLIIFVLLAAGSVVAERTAKR